MGGVSGVVPGVSIRDLSGCVRSRLLKKPVEAFAEKSAALLADALARESHLDTYVVVGIALRAGEYETSTLF